MEKTEKSIDQFLQARSASDNSGHRLEPVINSRGVLYINDSRATSVNDTCLSILDCGKDIVLIMGGKDERNDYSLLKKLVKENVKAIICLSPEREKMFTAFLDSATLLVQAADVDEAVKMASLYSRRGDIVLFSPACPSYDIFDNYKNRGEAFRSAVMALDENK